jgi:hypothetical protein
MAGNVGAWSRLSAAEEFMRSFDPDARNNDMGCLEVDAHQQTSIKGLYAVGDVVSDLHQIAVGTGHTAVAATHIHSALPRNFRWGIPLWLLEWVREGILFDRGRRGKPQRSVRSEAPGSPMPKRPGRREHSTLACNDLRRSGTLAEQFFIKIKLHRNHLGEADLRQLFATQAH